MDKQQTTEEKIKETARIIFMKKGYAATKTREIAENAGINLALLNYYFRSKEKLFQQIMMESLSTFFKGIIEIFMSESTSLEEKIQLIVGRYIDEIKKQPDIPLFILSELRTNPRQFTERISGQMKLKDSVLYQQLHERLGQKKIEQLDARHILMNLMGMTLFPFIGRPMLEVIGEVGNEKFDELMEERKELIPIWIMKMLE